MLNFFTAIPAWWSAVDLNPFDNEPVAPVVDARKIQMKSVLIGAVVAVVFLKAVK